MRHLAPASLPCVWNGQPHFFCTDSDSYPLFYFVSKIRTTLQIGRTYCNGLKIIPICLTKAEVGLFFSKQIYIPTKQARSQHSNRNFVFFGAHWANSPISSSTAKAYLSFQTHGKLTQEPPFHRRCLHGDRPISWTKG